MEERIGLFDLNGTILNDTRIWFDAVRETFLVFGKEPPSLYEYIRGFSWDYLQRYRDSGIDASREEIKFICEQYYEAHMYRIKPFPGAYRTLKTLVENGVFIGLVSAQTQNLAVPLLKKFGLYQLFRYRSYHVLDKAAKIKTICETRGILPKNCYYNGDSPSDVTSAKKAGAKSVAFLGGGMPEDLVLEREPGFTVRDINEVLKFFGLERFAES